MPVNLPPTLPLRPIDGVSLGSSPAGIRYMNRDDLVVMVFEDGTVAGGVFTQNTFPAAPVVLSRCRMGRVRGAVINSGNANAATGEQGLEDARSCCGTLASLIDCDEAEILPFSTGVIGEFLPMDRMEKGIRNAHDSVRENGWNDAAAAILTTDTAPKGVSLSFTVDGKDVNATGMVKGSGMMRPDMATLLTFVATDARVSEDVANSLALDLAERSFNRMTIDGDTSTNDSFVIFATGKGTASTINQVGTRQYTELLNGLTPLVRELAIRTIRDGEGATKFITIRVDGGLSEQECLSVAYTIAHSPLVKTAAFGGDPNWGRFCMAIGHAGVKNLDPSRVSLKIDELPIAHNGLVAPDYDEELAAKRMSEPEFLVQVDLGRGSASAEIWTSDLSYDYVKINAEYRS